MVERRRLGIRRYIPLVLRMKTLAIYGVPVYSLSLIESLYAGLSSLPSPLRERRRPVHQQPRPPPQTRAPRPARFGSNITVPALPNHSLSSEDIDR